MIYLFITAVFIALITLMRYDVFKRGGDNKENEIMKVTNDKVSKRPLTNAGFIKRLQQLAKSKRRNKR